MVALASVFVGGASYQQSRRRCLRVARYSGHSFPPFSALVFSTREHLTFVYVPRYVHTMAVKVKWKSVSLLLIFFFNCVHGVFVKRQCNHIPPRPHEVISKFLNPLQLNITYNFDSSLSCQETKHSWILQ